MVPQTFQKVLNSAVLSLFVIYRQVRGRNIEQLSYRIELVEGLFTKYAHAVETRSISG